MAEAMARRAAQVLPLGVSRSEEHKQGHFQCVLYIYILEWCFKSVLHDSDSLAWIQATSHVSSLLFLLFIFSPSLSLSASIDANKKAASPMVIALSW